MEWASDDVQRLQCVAEPFGAGCVGVLASIMQQILSSSYSTSWSAACDSCMFPPEKISPDSSLEGMFVFFICSLYHYRVFLPPLFFLWWFLILQCLISLSYLYLSTVSYLFPHHSVFHFLSFLCLSALCPAAGGSRLGPSSVSGKVTLQLAARSIRGRSLPGRVTLTSVPSLSLLQHYATAGSQMLDWHWKVKIL